MTLDYERLDSKQLRKLAERLARHLFTNGSDEHAERIVLTIDKPVSRDLGGWSEAAAVDQLVNVLKSEPYFGREAVPALPQYGGCASCGFTVLMENGRAKKFCSTTPGVPTEAVPSLPHWQPIETAPKDKTTVLVALIRDDTVWRVSEAAFNELAWYTTSGEACHWRTHWAPMPLPAAPGVPPHHAITCPHNELAQRGAKSDLNLWGNLRCNCSAGVPQEKL